MDKSEGKHKKPVKHSQEPKRDESSKIHGPSGKSVPDLNRLGDARPTRIPKRSRKADVIVGAPKVKWKPFLAFIPFLAVAVAAAFAISAWNSVVLDDVSNIDYVRHSLKIQDFWINHWANTIGHPLSHGWVVATYAWDLTSFNWNPGWSHIVNLFLHFFACLYLYALTFRISWRLKNEGRIEISPYYVAMAITGLFAVHPLASGAVAYISGREGPLLTINYLLALNCFVIGYAAESISFAFWAYLVAGIFTAIGVFCSPIALSIPLVAALLGLLLKSAKQTWKEWLPIRGYEVIFFAVISVFMPIILFTGPPELGPTRSGILMPQLNTVSYCATQGKELISYYLRCALVPFGMSVDPPYTVASSFADPLAILGSIAALACAGAAWYFRKNAVLCLGWIFTLVGLFPTAFMPQAEYLADYHFYFSLLGLCLVGGWFLARYFNKAHKRAIVVSSCLLVLCLGLSNWRSHEWRSDVSLWKQALAVNPTSLRARIFYAQALSHEGKQDSAIKEAKEALKIEPNNEFASQILPGATSRRKTIALPNLP